MSENKSSLLIAGSIVVGFILLGAILLFGFNQMTFKVATVDINQIFKNSELGQQLNKEMSNKMSEIQGKLNLAKTDAEKNQLQADYAKFKSEKENAFVEKVKNVVAKVAKQKGVKAVSSPQVYVYSSIDITDDVIKELDK